jgi:hypothetical protein
VGLAKPTVSQRNKEPAGPWRPKAGHESTSSGLLKPAHAKTLISEGKRWSLVFEWYLKGFKRVSRSEKENGKNCEMNFNQICTRVNNAGIQPLILLAIAFDLYRRSTREAIRNANYRTGDQAIMGVFFA